MVTDEEEEDSEPEEEVLTRRSGRDKQPTRRYMERDEEEDGEDE